MDGLAVQGFLSLAFFLEYLLMGLHEKHGMLDSMLHRLIAYTMLAGSVFAGGPASGRAAAAVCGGVLRRPHRRALPTCPTCLSARPYGEWHCSCSSHCGQDG